MINWGGGILAMDYDAVAAKWLIGGYGGKLNSYDGSVFVNKSTNLSSGWGSTLIYSIKSNGAYWLVGGAGHKLNKWDGNSAWSDLTTQMGGSWDIRAVGARGGGLPYWLVGGTGPNIYRFDGANPALGSDITAALTASGFTSDVLAVSYSITGNYWLVGGKSGKLARYDGSGFTEVSIDLGFGSNDVNTIDWRDTGSGDGMFLIGGGSGKLSAYSGSVFTDHSADAGLDFSVIWSLKWTGTYWLIGGSQGASTRITAYNGALYYQYGALSYFNSDPVWAIGSNGGGDSGVNLMGGLNSRLNRSTGAWNTPSNTDYSGFLWDFGQHQIKCAGYNGSYWLIGGESGSLNRYDGTTYTDLRVLLEAADPAWKVNTVKCAGWNGSYWLIGGTGGKLARYDGSTFSSRTAGLDAGTAWGTNAINFIEPGNSAWLLGGEAKKLAISPDGNSFSALEIPPADWGGSADAILCADWAGAACFIGGTNGRLVYYDTAGAGSWLNLEAGLSTANGGTFNVNALKYDGTSAVRIGCSGGKLSEYKAGGFSPLTSKLINFDSSTIYGIDYNAAAGMWMYGGSQGKVNISIVSGTETFTDYSYSALSPPPGMIENFGPNAVNAVVFNGEYWIIAGDNAKLNRYGPAYFSPGWAYSTAIDQWFAGYTCATLTAFESLNGQQVEYSLSANNGATWLPAAPGSAVCFSGADNADKLRWRARLTTYFGGVSPLIDTVVVDFSRMSAPTYTVTATPTVTKTGTMTATGTRTGTPTNTPTVTQTATATFTSTRTGTPSATGTITLTNTLTATGTATLTASLTFTATPTLSITRTASPTSTNTPTFTRTKTQTVTLTRSPSETATATPTDTPTITATVTLTGTQTRTATATITLTATDTPTAVQTETGTATEALTPAFTATLTPVTGIALPAAGGFILYPNPVYDSANLSYLMAGPGSVTMRIYNEAGSPVFYMKEARPSGAQVSSISTRKAAPGVYFCLAAIDYDTGRRERSGVIKFIVLH